MQLQLNVPVVLNNPGAASGLGTFIMVSSDFGDAEVRIAYRTNADGAWHLLGAPTPNSTENRVVVQAAAGDYNFPLTVDARKVSVILTHVTQGNTPIAVSADIVTTLNPSA